MYLYICVLFLGREMLKRLLRVGIMCSYVLINAASFIIQQVGWKEGSDGGERGEGVRMPSLNYIFKKTICMLFSAIIIFNFTCFNTGNLDNLLSQFCFEAK